MSVLKLFFKHGNESLHLLNVRKTFLRHRGNDFQTFFSELASLKSSTYLSSLGKQHRSKREMASIHSPWEAPDTRGIDLRGELFISYTRGAVIFPFHVSDQQRWYQYDLKWIPVWHLFQYYLQTSANDATVSRRTNVFRAAQLFNPRFVKTTRPSVVDVNRIPEGSFLNDGLVIHRGSKGWAPDLHREIRSAYRWLQAWARHASVVEGCVLGSSVLISSRNWVCTSATILSSCRRVFSLLATMVGDQQHNTLENFGEAALVLGVNNR